MIQDQAEREAHIKRERAKARELRASQWWRQQIGPGVCYHCKNKFKKHELTMDHLIPLARGGKTAKNNVVVSCKKCNTERGYKLDVERTFEKLENEDGDG
jgi:5-methylcytosine-specific restriction protein A